MVGCGEEALANAGHFFVPSEYLTLRLVNRLFFYILHDYMDQLIAVQDQPEMPSGDEDESKCEDETKESSISDQLSGSEKSQ